MSARGYRFGRRLGTIAAGIVCLGGTLAGCAGDKPQAPGGPPPAPTVTVAPVEEREVTELDEFTGRLEAVNTVQLRPRVSGYIDRVPFSEGKEVRQGDLLFQIDPRPYRADLERAEADLERARSAAALASSNLERARRLFAAQAMSKEDFESRTSGAEANDAAVRAAQSALATARLNLEWTEVRAPISGRVGRAEVTVGNLVQAGAPTLAPLTTIVSVDPIYATFDADERTYLRYAAAGHGTKAGDPAGGQAVAYLGLANEDGFPHKGHVDFFDNQVDPRTGTVKGRAVFSNADRLFTPGLFARVRLEASGKHRAHLIADRAVGTDQDRKFVLVLKADSTVEYRPVQLGRLIDGYRVVTDGLKSGEEIVVNGLQRVRPGMKVVANRGTMLADGGAAPSGQN